MKNIYKLATDKAKKLGVKAPEEYYTDPTSEEGHGGNAGQGPAAESRDGQGAGRPS
jgi:hypothetical protein